MMMIWIYSLISVFIVCLISLIGIIALPLKEKKLNNFLLYFVSFSVGALLGDVFIHLLPEVVNDNGFGLNISLFVLFGIISSFIIEKILHWRHLNSTHERKHMQPFAMMNLFGDSVHNFIDGLIIGGSFLVSIPVGIASTIAVILHEIPQEIGDFGVLLHGGFSKNRALFFNFLTAITAVLGVITALILGRLSDNVSVFLIPFAAGNFIYIAGSDLIPELHKETKFRNSLLQFISLVLGILIMMSLLLLN